MGGRSTSPTPSPRRRLPASSARIRPAPRAGRLCARRLRRAAAEHRASGQQNRRSGGLAGFEIAMRLGGIGKAIALVDLDLDLAAFDHANQVLGRLLELGFSADIAEESR